MTKTAGAVELADDQSLPQCEHRIAAIEAVTCRFPLPEPIVLDDLQIHVRDYVILKVTTTSGLEGVAWALSRGAPIAEVVDDVVAPVAVGLDALAIPALLDRFERQLVLLGTEGLVQRAYSLLDIALWDIKGQVAGMPVWRLLGARTTEVPALLVDAYPMQGQDEQVLVERIATREEEGYRAFKLHAARDPRVTACLLASLRKKFGSAVDLIVDVSMAWQDPAEGVAAALLWAPYELAWIEDPFRGDRPDLIRRLRERSDAPIGAGDEVANPLAMRRLITDGVVDVVRLDATSQGGISGFVALATLAVAHGCMVAPHTYPEIHQHCAFSLPGVRYLELFAPQSPYDCTEAFLRPSSLVRASGGVVRPSDRLGLGIEIDWNAVRDHRLSGDSRR